MPAKGHKKKRINWKKKAWDQFSKYIRLRDCIKTTHTNDYGVCVTCGKTFPFKQLQAGHAIGGRMNSILFDEHVVNGQCGGCNGYQNGNYALYSIWYINTYGFLEWQEKVSMSKGIVKYTESDYQTYYQLYKDKYTQLLNTL